MRFRQENLWMHILAFFVARCEVLGMYPFATAFFLASILCGTGSVWMYSVILLGIASTLSFGAVIKYSIILLGIALFKLLMGQDRQKYVKEIVFLIGGVITIAVGIGYNRALTDDGYYVLQALSEGAIVICFSWVLYKTLDYIKAKQDIVPEGNEMTLGMLTLLSITLLGMPMELFDLVSILPAIALFIVMYFSLRFGMVYGTTVGAVCGAVSTVISGDTQYLTYYVVLGLFLGALKGVGRVGISIAAVGITLLMGQFYYDPLLNTIFIRGFATSILLLWCIPKRYIVTNSKKDTEDAIIYLNETLNLDTKNRLHEFAGAFKKLENTFGNDRHMKPCMEYAGVGVVDERKSFARQLGQIGDIIDSFTEDNYESSGIKKGKEYAIIEAMSRKKIIVKKIIMASAEKGRLRLFITAKSDGRIMTSKEAAAIASKVLNKHFRPDSTCRNIIGRDYTVLTLEEDTVFKCITGVRRVVKTGEKVSGDSFSFLDTSNGHEVMMLSDGMGSGDEAKTESETVIDSLEQLIEAGFNKELAVELLNSAVSFRNQGESFTTLDMCDVDMYTGVARFIKFGASTTFIRRGTWIETIKSTSLPVGVMDEVHSDSSLKKLYSGDMIIQISDGVLDGILFENKEEFLKELILKIDTNNPQEMADSVIHKILNMNRDGIRDDASVLAMSLWNKY